MNVAFFDLLLGTLLLRPYVFIFLAVALWISHCYMGAARTALFFCTTWAIAFLSELSSTRIGFPFGSYSYIETTRDRELWIFNVPFMDSVSFSFLLFASYSLARLLMHRPASGGSDAAADRPAPGRLTPSVFFLTVPLFVLIDVVIDPVALRGDRWFLGKIYAYAEEGIYFGVPLNNFAGWGFVGASSLMLYHLLEKRVAIPLAPQRFDRQVLLLSLGSGLYYAVLIFNLAVTFWIGEPVLGAVGILISLPISLGLLVRVTSERASPHRSL